MHALRQSGWRRLSHVAAAVPRMRACWRDAAVIGLLAVAAYAAASHWDAYEAFRDVAAAHEQYELDEFITVWAILPLAMLVFAVRRVRDLQREVDRRKVAEATAQRLARQDPLTGLPNRRLLAEQGAMLLARLRRDRGALAVLVIDLDGFKPINDLHGHAAGDAILREVAARLRENLREDDLAARTGGDEFIVALRGLSVPLASDAARRLAHRLTGLLSVPITVAPGVNASVGASIGISAVDAHAIDAFETAIQQADAALYRAKAEGRGDYRFHDPCLDAALRDRARLEGELRRAIPAGEIRPHFQPVVELASGELRGFEVLARWHHPQKGILLPAQFIAACEDAGMIGILTESLFHQAVATASCWARPLPIAVNISPRLLQDRGLPARLGAVLREHGIDPGRIELEVTETALVTHVSVAMEVMVALKALGMRLAMDDFGTGYSSLANLRALPFDRIKIDRSFVGALGTDVEAARIVTAVLALGQGLGLKITAEGIEDDQTAAMLRAAGCTDGQGWLFGAAMSAEEASDAVAERTRIPVH